MEKELKILVTNESVQIMVDEKPVLYISGAMLGKSDWIEQAMNVFIELLRLKRKVWK